MRRLAALSAALLLASCGKPSPSDNWKVTQVHTYPEHTRVTFTGQCPIGITDSKQLPTNCTRSEVKYTALREVCAVKHGGETCWYIPSDYDWVFYDQKPGREVSDFENWIFTNPHPRPTNEWDQSG